VGAGGGGQGPGRHPGDRPGRRRRAQADPAEAAWVVGHLRPLVGLAGGAAGDGGVRREEAFAAWRRFVEGLAGHGPAVLGVEDLHWADDVLLDFLDHLADWAAEVPLLVVTTTRLRADAEVPLPETVQALIAARLDTLPPERKALLHDAAVVGRVFWSGVLAGMGGVDEPEVRGGLRERAAKALLRRSRRTTVKDQLEYAFSHVLVRDVAYSQLPRAVRADKHRRAAEWLEALAPDRAEDRTELLAHHWQAALRYARVTRRPPRPWPIGLGWPCGRPATGPSGSTPSPPPTAGTPPPWSCGRPPTPSGRGCCCAWGTPASTPPRPATSCWWRPVTGCWRSVTGGPTPAKALVLAGLAQTPAMQGSSDEAIRVGRQALALTEELGLDDDKVRALIAIGLGRVFGGDPAGVDDLERAVAATGRNSPLSVPACGNLATSLVALGELARGFELQTRAREAAERFGLAASLRWLQAERTIHDYWRGDWRAALSGADRLIAEAEAGSPADSDGLCRLGRGSIRLARADLAGALADAAAAVELAKLTGYIDQLPALAFHARALLAGGRDQEAEAAAGQLLAVLEERGVLPMDPDWSGNLAVALHALGRGDELTRLVAHARTPTRWLQAAAALVVGGFERAAELYEAIGSRPDEAFARLRAAEQLLAAGRRGEGEAQLRRALAFYRRVGATAYLREGEALLTASA